MLPRYRFIIIAIVLFTVCGSGCSGSKDLTRDLPATMATVKSDKSLSKKIGIMLPASPGQSKSGALEALFLETLARTLHDEDSSLVLVTPQDEAYPRFLSEMATRPMERLNPVELAINSRRIGYHGVLVASLRDMRVFTKKTGILWFRKPKHFVSMNILLDVYDPYTAAKIVGALEELTVKISDVEFDAFIHDEVSNIEDLNETVADTAEALAEHIAETLEEIPWQVSIVDIRSGRFLLPAGLKSGLEQDQRLVVLEGRRIINGQNEERFVVPGTQIAIGRIVTIDEQTAEATGDPMEGVQVGDIVVPLK